MSLTLGDLKAVVTLIDGCAKRGAFEGSELYYVGGIRQRFAQEITEIEKEMEVVDPETQETED